MLWQAVSQQGEARHLVSQVQGQAQADPAPHSVGRVVTREEPRAREVQENEAGGGDGSKHTEQGKVYLYVEKSQGWYKLI